MKSTDNQYIIRTERVYSDPSGEPSEGFRVFVDRLWPRGESKEKFHYDLWAKDLAPSTELREWYHASPADRWDEFAAKYRAELQANPATSQLLATLRPHRTITLLYGSRDEQHNNAVVLADYLRQTL